MAGVQEKAADIKQAGEEKVDAATTDSASKPSIVDQAKEKAAAAKQGAADLHGKVTSQAAGAWDKTKTSVGNVNQYSDKKT